LRADTEIVKNQTFFVKFENYFEGFYLLENNGYCTIIVQVKTFFFGGSKWI